MDLPSSDKEHPKSDGHRVTPDPPPDSRQTSASAGQTVVVFALHAYNVAEICVATRKTG